MTNELKVIENQNQRVLITSQLAESYETSTENLMKNFNRNLDKYSLNIHFFVLEGQDLKDFKANGQIVGLPSNTNKLYLWTEKGALLHAKSLNTDKAWEVYDILIDTYFRAKQLQIVDEYLTMSEEDRAIAYFNEKKKAKQLAEQNEANIKQLEEQKPLVTFAETVLKSKDNILVRELSKIV